MPRKQDTRTGKFISAERTTTTVTERVTLEEPPPPPPVHVSSRFAAAGFAHLLAHPPPGAQWAHPEFIAGEAARAAQVTIIQAQPEPVVQVVTVPRTYRELEELDHDEFTEDDRAQLTMVLDGGEYLP